MKANDFICKNCANWTAFDSKPQHNISGKELRLCECDNKLKNELNYCDRQFLRIKENNGL